VIYQEYISSVKTRFESTKTDKIGGFDVDVAFFEIFKWKWLATKLKIFSYISYVEKIDQKTISDFSDACFLTSKKNYKGLPRGVQNGFASFIVIVSEDIDVDAIAFAESRPKKHFAAFDMPVVVDLKNEKIYFYHGKQIWGSIYYRFFREFIIRNFDF